MLGNLPTLYLSLFVAPVGVIDKLEEIRRKFIWGGVEDKAKINWVSWNQVVAPKSDGGLGIGSLSALNISLTVKMVVEIQKRKWLAVVSCYRWHP